MGQSFRQRMSMPVSVFGYKTSAEYVESSMYFGGDREGKPITNCDIFAYVKDGKYPADYTKDEKRALRKRAKFFVARGT